MATRPATALRCGGPGNDQLLAGQGSDELHADDGNDLWSAGDGDDDLYDSSTGATGADDISGGNGYDRIWYDQRTSALAISIDNLANDGAAGEGDNLRTDVEQLFGGREADTLVAAPAPTSSSAGGAAPSRSCSAAPEMIRRRPRRQRRPTRR